MRKFSLLALALVALTGAVAVPAEAAKPGNRCQPIAVSYVVSGTLTVSGVLVADPAPAKTYGGILTVHVTQTDKHAKADKNQIKIYTLSHANVAFGAGVNTTLPAVGSRVTLKGTITTLAPKCSRTGFAPMIVIKKVEIHRAKTH